MVSECDICGKVCRSTTALQFHKQTHDNRYKTTRQDPSRRVTRQASSVIHTNDIYNIPTTEPEVEPKPEITSSKYGFCDVCGTKKEKWLLGKCGLWCNKILCTDCFIKHVKECERTEDYQDNYIPSYQKPQPQPEPQEIYKEPEDQEELYECELCNNTFNDIIECKDCEGLFCKRCFNYHECED